MNSLKRLWPLLAATVVAVGIAVCLRPTGREADGSRPSGKPAAAKRVLKSRPKTAQQDPKTAVQEAVAGRKLPQSRVGAKPGFDEFLDSLAPDDRRRVLSVQDALDSDDFEAVAKASRHALASTNAAVREAAVEALGWFGAAALPDLTPLMADGDDDVAEAAMSQWTLALSEIDEPETKATIAEAVMRTLTNKDALQSIVCEITNQDDDFTVLESLVTIIESDNAAGAEVAREEYETLTGEEWAGIDAANQWIAENYEPPEPDDED